MRCTGVADVRYCVNATRENDLLVAVRSGGHGVAGNASCDGGLMIDLSLMRGVRSMPGSELPGSAVAPRWGILITKLSRLAWSAPAGVVSETGIAGLALGGGFGWVRGKYGMSVDNILSVDIVTADGELRHTNASENPDLFWAVRGGRW